MKIVLINLPLILLKNILHYQTTGEGLIFPIVILFHDSSVSQWFHQCIAQRRSNVGIDLEDCSNTQELSLVFSQCFYSGKKRYIGNILFFVVLFYFHLGKPAVFPVVLNHAEYRSKWCFELSGCISGIYYSLLGCDFDLRSQQLCCSVTA